MFVGAYYIGEVLLPDISLAPSPDQVCFQLRCTTLLLKISLGGRALKGTKANPKNVCHSYFYERG